MRSTIYQAIELSVDGGSTNKCKKNIASVIITSMIAGLTEQQVTQVPVKALLCVFFFILSSTFEK